MANHNCMQGCLVSCDFLRSSQLFTALGCSSSASASGSSSLPLVLPRCCHSQRYFPLCLGKAATHLRAAGQSWALLSGCVIVVSACRVPHDCRIDNAEVVIEVEGKALRAPDGRPLLPVVVMAVRWVVVMFSTCGHYSCRVRQKHVGLNVGEGFTGACTVWNVYLWGLECRITNQAHTVGPCRPVCPSHVPSVCICGAAALWAVLSVTR